MIRLILLVVIFILGGCGEVDRDVLRALNSVEKNITEDLVSKKIVIIDQVSVKDINKIVKTKNEKSSLAFEDIKFKQFNLEEELTLKLSLAKLESETSKQLKDKELQNAQIEADTRVKLAQIDLQKIQEIEISKQLVQKRLDKKELEIAALDRDVTVQRDIDLLELYKIIAIAVGVILFLSLMIFFFLKRKSQQSKVQMHNDELKQQLHLKAIENQSKNLDKMLDLISSKDVSTKVKKELLNSIKDSHSSITIFDEKPKKGLIFKK